MTTFAGKGVTTLAVGVCLVASVARAGILVPSTNSSGAWTPVLAAGQEHLFVASGTYTYRADGYWADAEFSVGPEVPGVPQEVCQYQGIHSLEKDILDLLINLTAVDWQGSRDGNTWAPHTYSPDHVYRYYYTGTGSEVRLSISDWYPFYDGGDYSDNSGSLNVEITAIPEPSTLMGLLSMAIVGLGLGWWRRRKRAA